MTAKTPNTARASHKCTDLYTSTKLARFQTIPALAFAAAAMLAAPLPAAGQTPVGAAEFEALTTGKTIEFTSLGVHVGTEHYRKGRRVLWRRRGGFCMTGTWFPKGSAICFRYEDTTEAPACWLVVRDGTTLIATNDENPASPPLISRSISEEPMDCPAPDLGV